MNVTQTEQEVSDLQGDPLHKLLFGFASFLLPATLVLQFIKSRVFWGAGCQVGGGGSCRKFGESRFPGVGGEDP